MSKAAVSVVAGLMMMPVTAQVGGSLVAFPPVELTLDITESADGAPHISVPEIPLITGEYYRLNVTSSGTTDWRLE